MAEKINVGKFINNLDSEDLSSEKLQGVVGNVYAKAIRDHKTTAKKAEDNLKDKDKETVEFTKSNHDRLKAHKNKPEKDLNKDDAPVKDKVVKEINESFSIKDFKKQWAEYKKSGSSDELEFGDWYYQFDVDFDKGTIFAGEPHKDIMGWSISRDFEIKLDPSVDIYGNISKLHDYIETKRKGVKESKKQRSPFRKVNESHDCKRNYKNVRFASQEIEKKGYSHAEANDIALKLFDDIEGDTQRSLEWHLEKILPKEEFDKEYPRNESLKEDTFAVRLKNDTADVRYEFVKASDEEDARRQLDKKFSKKGWKVTDIGVADPKATNPYDALKKESKSVAESKKTVGNKKLTEAKTFQPMTLREYGKKFLDGYLDTDVYDTEIDMGVAFVFDCDEEPTDNYEKFLSILADNVMVKDAFNDGALTCDFSGFYKPYNDKINDWYKKNGGHQEFEGEEGYYDLVLATEGLVSGSYSEEDYKELCDIFKTKVESKNIVEAPIPRNATKIKVGGKEFTKEKDWVDGNRVHVSPKDIKRLYGDDVEVLETDPNYKSKRTKEVKVLQGNYGYGWDDLVEYDKEDSAELKQDLRSYRENERNAQFRVITRRVPLGEEKLSEGAKPSELWYNKKEVLNNIWGLVCEGDDRLEDIRYIFESGLLKPNEFRYDGWGAKHSLIMGALRNGNYKAAELLKSLGEKILKSEVEEYKDLMARKVYSDETTRDALDEAKSSKKLIYTIGDRFVAHQLDGVTSPFNREFDAAKKYRDVSNDPNFKHGSIGCKGKSYKAGVNQWVKDVEPTEFMVWTKKENPSWKDDVLDVYYRKETVNESKELTEGKKIDLYVNGEYVCSSTRYKKVKDFVDAVKKDGKVTYAGLDNNGKLSDKVTKTIKDTDKVVGRIVTESKKLTEEVHDGDMFEIFGLQFSLTWLDHTGDEPDEFAIVCDSIPNDYDNEPTWIGKTVSKDATEKEIKELCKDWIYDQPEETFKDFEVVNELPDGTWFFADEETMDSLKKEFGKNMEWLPHENMWQLYRPKEKMKTDVDELPWDPWEKELDYAERNYGPDESLKEAINPKFQAFYDKVNSDRQLAKQVDYLYSKVLKTLHYDMDEIRKEVKNRALEDKVAEILEHASLISDQPNSKVAKELNALLDESLKEDADYWNGKQPTTQKELEDKIKSLQKNHSFQFNGFEIYNNGDKFEYFHNSMEKKYSKSPKAVAKQVFNFKYRDDLTEDLSKIQEEQTMKLVRLLGKGLITKQEFEQKLYGIIDEGSKLVRAPMFKNIKIKDFYTDNYPEDDLGEEINDTVTVDDVVDTLNNGGDLYKLIGVTDSLVRERLFEFIADICNTKYDRVYNKWLEEGLVETGRKFLIESQTQEIEQIMNRLKKEFGPEIEAKMDEFVNLPENSKKVWKSGYKIIPDEEIEKDYEITYFQTPEHEPMYARKSDGSYARYGQVLDYSDIFYTEEGWNKFEKWLNDQGIFDTSTHFAISKFDNWPDGYWSTDTERFSTVDGAKRVADRKFKSADVVKIEDDRTHFGTANGETVRFKGKWMTEDDFFKLRNSKKA